MATTKFNRGDDSTAGMLDHLIPDAELRRLALDRLRSSIEHAHSEATASWVLTSKPSHIRLNVGQIAVLGINAHDLHVFTVAGLRPSGGAYRLAGWRSFRAVNVPTERWVVPLTEISNQDPDLWDRHNSLISTAAKAKRTSPFKRFHSTELVRVISAQIGRPLPQPGHIAVPDPHSGAKPVTGPSVTEYRMALNAVGATELQRQILELHYNAPGRTITATEVARVLGFNHYSTVNGQYGRLGRRIREYLGSAADSIDQRLGMLVTFHRRNNEWHWTMRPEVAEALESLGWITWSKFPSLIPEEINGEAAGELFEGASVKITVNAYERNREARRKCLEIHGATCAVCDFDFGQVYGDFAAGYIHVHHLRPLSEIGMEYVVNPAEDLRPVCPNCHAVIHLRTPAYELEEVREMLRKTRGLIPNPGDQS